MPIGKGSLRRVAEGGGELKKEPTKQTVMSLCKLPIAELIVKGKADDSLVLSLKRFGQLAPVTVTYDSEGKPILLDGKARILALKKLGESEVWATVVSVEAKELSEAKKAFFSTKKEEDDFVPVKREITPPTHKGTPEKRSVPIYLL